MIHLTKKQMYIAVAVVVVLALLTIAGSSYLSYRVAQARADQVRADMKPIHEQAAQEKHDLFNKEDANQKALVKALDVIAAQKAKPVATQVDYDRIGRMIEERIPGVRAEAQKPAAGVPNAPSSVGVTGDDAAKKVRDYMLECDATKTSLGSCRETVTNVSGMLVSETNDHKATKNELAAERKSHGKGFMGRVGNCVARGAVGGAGGGLSGDWRKAAGGAAIGLGSCLIWKP